MSHTSFENPEVKTIFNRYSPAIKQKLMDLRELIFKVAAEIDEVGVLEETLKWNQPSYLPSVSASGTTIRIDHIKNQPNQYAVFVHCQTTLIENFRMLHPDFTYDGTRAIIFDVNDELPVNTVTDFIAMALTYHLQKDKAQIT